MPSPSPRSLVRQVFDGAVGPRQRDERDTTQREEGSLARELRKESLGNCAK